MFPAFNKNHVTLTVISACILYASLSISMNSSSLLIRIMCSLSMIGSLTYINMSNWIHYPSFNTIDFLLSFITSCIMTLFLIIGFSFINPASTALRALCGFCAAIPAMLLSFHFYLKMIINRY